MKQTFPGRLAKHLHHIVRNRPMRLIMLNGKPYLERYYIGVVCGRTIWLHHFLTSDGDRNVHDHPWSALSVILTGGYWEETPGTGNGLPEVNYQDFRAPALNYIPGTKKHRIVSVATHTWTMMIVSPKHGRGWFFYGPDGSKERGGTGGKDWHVTAPKRDNVYSAMGLRP